MNDFTLDEAKAAYFKTGSASRAAELIGTTRYRVMQKLRDTGVLTPKKGKKQLRENGVDYIKQCLSLKVGQKIKVPLQKEKALKTETYIGMAEVSEIYPNFVVIKNKKGVRSCYTYGELYALYSGGGRNE